MLSLYTTTTTLAVIVGSWHDLFTMCSCYSWRSYLTGSRCTVTRRSFSSSSTSVSLLERSVGSRSLFPAHDVTSCVVTTAPFARPNLRLGRSFNQCVYTVSQNTAVWWRELGEVENKYTSHNFSLFAIFLPKIIKIGGNLTKFWQKQLCTVFFETRCRMVTDSILCHHFNKFKWMLVICGRQCDTVMYNC